MYGAIDGGVGDDDVSLPAHPAHRWGCWWLPWASEWRGRQCPPRRVPLLVIPANSSTSINQAVRPVGENQPLVVQAHQVDTQLPSALDGVAGGIGEHFGSRAGVAINPVVGVVAHGHGARARQSDVAFDAQVGETPGRGQLQVAAVGEGAAEQAGLGVGDFQLRAVSDIHQVAGVLNKNLVAAAALYVPLIVELVMTMLLPAASSTPLSAGDRGVLNGEDASARPQSTAVVIPAALTSMTRPFDPFARLTPVVQSHLLTPN